MKKKITFFSGVFGNGLEWYDFTIYAFFAPILAGLYFPTKSPFVSLLLTFSVFALSFLVRPIGGILFGYLGDHFGRRKALLTSIIVMSLPTLALAVLPDYSHIGIAAPIFLTLLRLIQGMAVSGELTTATSFLVEHSDSHKRGFSGSLAMGSAFVGILISSAIATMITNFMSHDDVLAWGWRIAFGIGGIVGLIGLFFRLLSHETQLFQEAQKNILQTRPSVVSHFVKLDWKSVVLAVLLTCVMAVGNYFLIGFFNVFLTKNLNFPMKEAMIINFACLTVLTILIPIMGILSDRIGRKSVLKFGIIGMLVLAYPIFFLFSQQTIYTALLAELLFVIALAPISALIPTTLAELFETHSRNAGMSIGYNVSLAIFGGTAPLVAMSLVNITKNNYSPAWYLIACAIISLLALLNIRESYKKQLI